MEMPITKPSMVSYADELDFAQLLEKLLKDKHNGFLRVTSGPEEGYILFKNGKQVAASYDRFSKSEAVESIKFAVEKSDTVIEVFDLRRSHIDYLTNVNKPYLMESDYDVYKVIEELKNSNKGEAESTTSKGESVPESGAVSTGQNISELNAKTDFDETEPEKKPDADVSPISPDIEPKPEIKPVNESKPSSEPQTVSGSESLPKTSISESSQTPESSGSVAEPSQSPESTSSSEQLKTREILPEESNTASEVSTSAVQNKDSHDQPISSIQSDSEADKTVIDNKTASMDTNHQSEGEIIKGDVAAEIERVSSLEVENEAVIEDTEEKSMDRSKLLKKYGIKEMNEDDVENILESYKGGAIDDDDVEKIEFTLMNKIKKSVFVIPKIKGAEVMVFLENSVELTGNINIIIEYEAKGFFSRLIGESKDIENLRRQIINIVQIEIKKSFRKYPEIINNFDINVEIS